MKTTSIVLSIASVALLALFFRPAFLNSRLWRATVTPLASIIGSGFLVAGPILAHAVGHWAWLAMLGLCAAAYLFGAAIRDNIAHVEPTLDTAPLVVTVIERLSDWALSGAYFVSVAYYLNLFAAFGLRLGDVIDPFSIRVASTTVIAALGVLGATKGLRGLEHLEVAAVGLKLSVIGGLFATLMFANFQAWTDGTFAWTVHADVGGFEQFRILLGLLILVQGFETSRYLGEEYDTATRIRTMRWAQWIATGIYLVFMILVTRYFAGSLPEKGGETAIIDILSPVGAALAPTIIIAALASQLSAATADMNGAGGLIAETSRKRVSVKIGNLVTAAVAIAITWAANIYEIIAIASQVFVAYYALQSLQATLSAWRRGATMRAAIFAAATVLAVFIVIFAIPADA
ncbi:MAG: hypothetical protein KDE14_14565 [Rhodobacteraceae bacterium]|nr:hypothetical protein [Paracoccaceae bacterium]